MLQALFVLPALYGVIFITIVLINRNKDKEYVRANPADISNASTYAKQAARGKTGIQLMNFICHVIILLIAGGSYLISFIYSQVSEPKMENIAYYIIFGLILLVINGALSIITLVANSLWAYPKTIRLAEAYAIEHKTATTLMKTQRVIAWIVWIGFTLSSGFSAVYAISVL
jgi:hypothetical protein